MLSHWLHKQDKSKLIVFFCGWGNDYKPFESISSSDYDVLCLYAYHQNAPVDIESITQNYNEIYLVAWSMGVLQAELQLANSSISFTKALAINGTLKPVDDNYGIPHSAYQLTIDSFSERARSKFFQRMCKDRAVMSRFQENLPDREVEEQKEELIYHQEQSLANENTKTQLFSHVLIGEKDMIFPPNNMIAFWENQVSIMQKPLPHFVFYSYDSWDQLIDQY